LLLKLEEKKKGERERVRPKTSPAPRTDKRKDAVSEKEIEALRNDLKRYASVSGDINHDMIGEGTGFPVWYVALGGAALSVAMNKEYEIVLLQKKISQLEQDLERHKQVIGNQRRPHTTGNINQVCPLHIEFENYSGISKERLPITKRARGDLRRHYLLNLREMRRSPARKKTFNRSPLPLPR